jgi:hypothetical protein
MDICEGGRCSRIRRHGHDDADDWRLYQRDRPAHFLLVENPDEMLLHEINKMLNESNVRKLASVDFSTGGDHGKSIPESTFES